MSKKLKKLLALLLTTVMILGMLPTLAFAADANRSGAAQKVHVYTEAENAKLDNGVFAKIQSVKNVAANRMGGIGRMTEADYVSVIPQVVKAIESSDTYVKGSLQRNGNFLVWQTTVGIPCCYDPRMEAKLHNTENAPSAEEIARVEADAASLLDEVVAVRGGSPTSANIGLIQPYWESSSSYSDSSFTSYSPYYKTTWQNLYNKTGGQGIRYSMTNATVDNIAKTIQQCGLVIFDSHGTTDYSGSNSDYTSRANSSYLCLTTNSGVTSTDTAAHTGTYGTYYDCMKGSGYAYVNGQCIANHMTSNAPHSMVYMGICLGMATDRMEAPLRAKGVEVVYGYSQSVSFKGELKSIQSIMGYIKDGMQAGAAIEQSQVDLGCQWDPAYPSYTESQAKSNKIAFPVVSSSEDTYPGHGNVDRVLTAKSTWTLQGSASYTVTATTNNSSYGTVSVNGYTITASPKTGYYASGYTVTSGTATVVQNGNTFTVTPSSDCTVRINFAAKTQYTVTLKANGSTYTTLSAYSGDSVTLPTTATSVSGYTFVGWAASTVSETTNKPTYYASGASYAPTANVTLYALYTRTEGSGGSTVYQKVSGVENGGQYIIVASDSISGTTGYAVGNTAVTSSHYLTPVSVTISNDVASASSSNLAKVLWTASGNSSNGYTFYNSAAGKYMGLDSSEYLAPTSSGLAWKYTSNGYLDNQTDSEGYYYLSYSSSSTVRYTTSKSGAVINFYKATSTGTTYYTTSPSTTTHEHSYGSWYSNNNGTHSRTCSCGDVETANCTYTSVVTAPTTTSQGYTTYTCTVCGYSYKADYTDPVTPTTTYTVSFSVPSGVSAVSSQTVTSGNSITLPTAGAPSGYTFLGWTTSTVNNSTSAPSYLTGTYTPTANVTLNALYTYTATSGGSETAYELIGSAPTDWSGNYIITYGTNTSSLYVLKGLSGNTRYESTSAGGSVLYSNTGMTYADGYMTGVTNAYVFTIAKTGSYYTIRNASTGTYLGSYSSYLYSRSSYSSSYCRWMLSMSSGNVTAKNNASSRYPYLSFSSSKYFMMGSSAPTGLYFWKETTTGGTTTTYYTTVIG